MTDVRELFPILDDGTGAGAPLDKAVDATTPAAGLCGSVGFAFQDSTGDVILPTLNPDGTIPVSTDGVTGVCKSDHGEDATGNLALTTMAGVEITLATDKDYRRIGWSVNASRHTLFQLIAVEDQGGGGEVETILTEAIVGPGQYTFCCQLDCREFTTDSTANTKKIFVKYKNFEKAVCSRATIWAEEFDA